MPKNEKLYDSLVQFGLDDNEAKVYLASLALGPSTVLKLAKHSEVKRTTVYEVITALEHKGLMKKEVHGFKTLYAPEPPSRLENTLETKRVLLSKTLPALEGLFHLKGTEGSIKYYEGIKLIKNVYDDLLRDLKPHDYYYAISNIAEWQNLDEDFFFRKHVQDRANLRVDTKLIFQDSPTAQNRKKTERNFNEEIKVLTGHTETHVDLVITPYKLVMFQLHQPLVAIVIENKSMIDMQKSVFEMLWGKLE